MLNIDLDNLKDIICELLDCVLTVKQKSLIDFLNFKIMDENMALIVLRNNFSKNWNELDNSQKFKLESIGVDKKSYNVFRFPKLTFDQMSSDQKINILKLGFTETIWDQKLIETNNSASINNYILHFSIDIPGLIACIPNYIRNLILNKIKIYFESKFLLYQINVHYSDNKLLDLVVMFNLKNKDNSNNCKNNKTCLNFSQKLNYIKIKKRQKIIQIKSNNICSYSCTSCVSSF